MKVPREPVTVPRSRSTKSDTGLIGACSKAVSFDAIVPVQLSAILLAAHAIPARETKTAKLKGSLERAHFSTPSIAFAAAASAPSIKWP